MTTSRSQFEFALHGEFTLHLLCHEPPCQPFSGRVVTAFLAEHSKLRMLPLSISRCPRSTSTQLALGLRLTDRDPLVRLYACTTRWHASQLSGGCGGADDSVGLN